MNHCFIDHVSRASCCSALLVALPSHSVPGNLFPCVLDYVLMVGDFFPSGKPFTPGVIII